MNVSSHKRLREEMVLSKANDVFYQTVVFSEWFLTKLLDYLSMREIVSLDSAICNKSDRVYWLKCIAKNVGSVSTKVHGYVTDDESARWCAERKIQFKCLDMESLGNRADTEHSFRFGERKKCLITIKGASLLSMCCNEMVELILANFLKPKHRPGDYLQINRDLLKECGKVCSKLKRLNIKSQDTVTDNDIISLIKLNHDLKEIGIFGCRSLSKTFLIQMSAHCHNLQRISFTTCYTDPCKYLTDAGFLSLISNNPNLEEVILAYPFLSDASFKAMAQHCHKLRKISLTNAKYMTDKSIMALVSSNHDLEEIKFNACVLLTDASCKAIVEHCHKLRKICLKRMSNLTVQGFYVFIGINVDWHIRDCKNLTDGYGYRVWNESEA